MTIALKYTRSRGKSWRLSMNLLRYGMKPFTKDSVVLRDVEGHRGKQNRKTLDRNRILPNFAPDFRKTILKRELLNQQNEKKRFL